MKVAPAIPTEANTNGEWSGWSGACSRAGGQPSDMMQMLHYMAVMPSMSSKWEKDSGKWARCGSGRREYDRRACGKIKF
jgi:hypothetical protein